MLLGSPQHVPPRGVLLTMVSPCGGPGPQQASWPLAWRCGHRSAHQSSLENCSLSVQSSFPSFFPLNVAKGTCSQNECTKSAVCQHANALTLLATGQLGPGRTSRPVETSGGSLSMAVWLTVIPLYHEIEEKSASTPTPPTLIRLQ